MVRTGAHRIVAQRRLLDFACCRCRRRHTDAPRRSASVFFLHRRLFALCRLWRSCLFALFAFAVFLFFPGLGDFFLPSPFLSSSSGSALVALSSGLPFCPSLSRSCRRALCPCRIGFPARRLGCRIGWGRPTWAGAPELRHPDVERWSLVAGEQHFHLDRVKSVERDAQLGGGSRCRL